MWLGMSDDVRCKAVPASWVGPLDGWCEFLAAAGRRVETVKLRRAHVAQVARGVASAPAVLEVDELLGWLASRAWSRSTRRAVRASLRGFFGWYGRPELAEAVPVPGPDRPIPRPAPDEALVEALRRADDRTTLVLRLAGEAGLRRGEIATVHANDVIRDLLGWSLVVHGKGGHQRLVPLSDGLAHLVRRTARSNGGWLLPGAVDGHLSARRVGELAGEVLPTPWTLHTLRHRFATRAYAASGDLLGVSMLLGHASVATTQRYVATDAARLRAVAESAA